MVVFDSLVSARKQRPFCTVILLLNLGSDAESPGKHVIRNILTMLQFFAKRDSLYLFTDGQNCNAVLTSLLQKY